MSQNRAVILKQKIQGAILILVNNDLRRGLGVCLCCIRINEASALESNDMIDIFNLYHKICFLEADQAFFWIPTQETQFMLAYEI